MFEIPIQPDIEGLLRNLRRQGTPERTYFIELPLDPEVIDAVCARFSLAISQEANPLIWKWRRDIAVYRFLGYEILYYRIPAFVFPRDNIRYAEDTAPLRRPGGRPWFSETQGIINSWQDFERYPWPDPKDWDLSDLAWLDRNLPEDMGISGSCHSVFEQVTWLMSYQGLCYSLYDQPDLVDAMFARVGELYLRAAEMMLDFACVRMLFDGDDMGFKTSTMVPPWVLIEKSFPWHRRMAAAAHTRGKLYMLHSCGKLDEVMPALIDDVRIDGKHSFEDVIEPVTEAKRRWGERIAILGGIDVDFLCRATEDQVRRRVRETLEVCLPGGGYCLGTGNTVANYIPLENYLAMLDEGRRYTH